MTQATTPITTTTTILTETLVAGLLTAARMEADQVRGLREQYTEQIKQEEAEMGFASYETRDLRYAQVSRLIELEKLINNLQAHADGRNG